MSLRSCQLIDVSHGNHRWIDSKQTPSDGILIHLGLTPGEMDRHVVARDVNLDAFTAHYLRRQAERSPEQIAEARAEARAAHGTGVELFTGERYIT